MKISARLPVGERNGLDSLGAQVAHHPTGRFVVMAICDVDALTTKVESDVTTATLRIRRIEALGREDLADAEELMRRALEHRTGQPMLPEDIEVEITQAFRPDEADAAGDRTSDELRGRRARR